MRKPVRKPILVVDGDRDIVEIISNGLGAAGYQALMTTSGKTALDYLQKAQEQVGLILLGLVMPGMDGWEFRDLQRQDPKARDIPVVILTAGGHTGKKARHLEAAGFLEKPVRFEALLHEVYSILTLGQGGTLAATLLPNRIRA